MTRYIVLLFLLPCILAVSEAAADTGSDQPTAHDHTVLINPLGPAVGALAASLALPTISANLRYQHARSDRLALVVAPQFTTTDFVTFRHSVATIKLGPRISLSRRRLEGWYVHPMAIIGWAWTTQRDRRLHSAGVAGLGVEAGRAWHWRRFVLEFGLGAHYTGYVAHYSPLTGQSGDPPEGGFGPILNLSLGYGW